MKIREFILVFSVVAMVALLLFKNEPDRSISETNPPAKKTAEPSLPAAFSEMPNPQVSTDFEFATDCDFGTGEVPEPPEKTDGLVLVGKQAYLKNCALCHGVELDGTGDGGRSLIPPPTNLRLSQNFKYGYDPRSIYKTTAYGIEGTGMAPWDDIITPNDMWAIAFYIESHQPR